MANATIFFWGFHLSVYAEYHVLLLAVKCSAMAAEPFPATGLVLADFPARKPSRLLFVYCLELFKYPRLYTLHLTPYTLRSTPYALHRRSHHLSCARRWLAVSSVFPCQSVLIRGRYIFPATCCVLPLVWQNSRLFPFASVGSHALVIPIASKSLPLHLTHSPYTKNNHQKCIFL